MNLRSYTLCLILLISLGTFGGCNSGPSSNTEVNGVKIPNILPEDTVSGTREEQFNIRTTFDKAIAELEADADNPQPFINLATLYILEGRISGNGSYYSNAAIKMLN